jgi:hypothetical protein
VHLEGAALGIEHREGDRRVGRDIDLERTIGFDRRIAEDLVLLEVRVADCLALSGRA